MKLLILICWQEVANKLEALKKELQDREGALAEIRQTVLELSAPPQLVRFTIKSPPPQKIKEG